MIDCRWRKTLLVGCLFWVYKNSCTIKVELYERQFVNLIPSSCPEILPRKRELGHKHLNAIIPGRLLFILPCVVDSLRPPANVARKVVHLFLL